MTAIPELTQRDLPYRPDAALRYFTPLAHHPWAMLLSSAAADHAHNRYDIVVADPCATLQTRGEQTQIATRDGACRDDGGDPLTLLRTEIDRYLPRCPPQPDLPFCGGLSGCGATISGDDSNICPARPTPICRPRTWRRGSTTGR